MDMPFSYFVSALQDAAKTKSSRGKRRQKEITGPLRTLVNTFRKYSKAQPNANGQVSQEDSFFPVMRLLLPQNDLSRKNYNMKESALAKNYLNILNVSETSQAGKQLLNWTIPELAGPGAGDFARVVRNFLANGREGKSNKKLTLSYLNTLLDELGSLNDLQDLQEKKSKRKSILTKLLTMTTAEEHEWLIKIILKEIKGIGEKSVFNAFHPDAYDLWNQCCNLSKVCQDLHDPNIRLQQKNEVQLMVPFKPMLGQRETDLTKIHKSFKGAPFYIETKYDGDRVALHKDGDKYMYHTRSGKTWDVYGNSPETGNFTPFVHNLFAGDTHNCILDGEMISWHLDQKRFVAMGENVAVRNLGQGGAGDDDRLQPCFIVFDILMYNGVQQCSNPLSFRRNLLEAGSVFRTQEGRLVLGSSDVGETLEDLVSAAEKSVSDKEEGIVLKASTSYYELDTRAGGGWWKWKPEYVDSLSDHLDLLVVGGYYSKGSRGKSIMSVGSSDAITGFMLAVPDTFDPDTGEPKTWVSFCKVGTGYTYEQLVELNKRLGSKMKPSNPKYQPSGIASSVTLAPPFKQLPDLWIEPRESIVLEVKAAEMQKDSEEWAAGYTLRFPRVVRIRYDKAWKDTNTLKDVHKLIEDHGGRLTSLDRGGVLDGSKKRKRDAGHAKVEKVAVTVADDFRPTLVDKSTFSCDSVVFKGLEFCVLKGSDELPKKRIEELLHRNGGSFVQNPGEHTHACVAEYSDIESKKLNSRVQAVIKIGKYDIVRPLWLSECINSKRVIRFLPAHLISMTDTTKTKLRDYADEFGDCYTEWTSAENLSSILESAAEINTSQGTSSRAEMADIERLLFFDNNTNGLFRPFVFYFDRYREVLKDHKSTPPDAMPSALDRVLLKAQYRGASTRCALTPDVTHVICNKEDSSRLDKIQEIVRSRTKYAHVVSMEWLEDCLLANRLIEEQGYRI
eukprot:m.211217 g.211217  ORF g.211217 m.211217 type:complete len:956 (-) comp15833_c0_seq2:4120-6987(-)